MAQVPRRSPRATSRDIKKVGRPSAPKHTELYVKRVTLIIAGAKPSQHTELARDVLTFIGNHKYVKGGKTKSSLTVTSDRTKPVKVFDGVLSPDSV